MKTRLLLFLALSALFILPNFQFVSFVHASPGPDVAAYYPSGYNLFGSTKNASGSLTDLQSDNSVYMTFRSYVSSTSATANTRAFISYRDSTTSLSTPKERTWDGSAWGSQTEMATAGSSVRFVRVAYSPVEQRSFEKIVVTLSDDGYLDAYVWDGTSWTVTNNIGNVGTAANAYKCFDIAYEKTSGEALLVYSAPPATNFQIAYRTWSFTSGWSGENTYVISSAVTETANWISMASKPTSGASEIAVGVIGDATALDAYGLIWNGTSFSSQQLLTDIISIATEECMAVAYEQTSGYATFVSSTGNNAFSWQWSGTAWDASATTFDLSGTSTPNWFTLKSNPINDELFAVSVDGGSDLNTAYWSGSAWTLHTEHDATVDTNAQRPADFAWEPTGSKGLLVWGTTTGQIAYKTYTAPNTWGTQQNPTMGANIHPWVQLRTNSRSVTGDIKILGAVLEGTVFDIGAIKWDGTTFTIIGTNTISSDTTVITYECFEMEFELFGPPTEFTNEVEFTGASNTYSWTQLVWTVDSAWTMASVTTTLQLYNYTLGGYPISGNGYISYTSSGTANTDETKSQTITTNPADFRDSAGNWKVKVKGIKLSSLQFDFKGDLIKFEVTYVPTVGYALNLRVLDWDLTDPIQRAYVYKDSDIKLSDANGWANWTGVSGTVQIKVKWYGFWVNGTFSVNVDSAKTINVRSNIFDIVVTTVEAVQGALLQYANVTVYNATSVGSNKIRTGITGSDGKVSLANVPNATLTFTVYDGASPKHVIANVTRTITAENQAETIICNQNYISTTHTWSILEVRVIASLGFGALLLIFNSEIVRHKTCLKERVRTIRSKHKLKRKEKGG